MRLSISYHNRVEVQITKRRRVIAAHNEHGMFANYNAADHGHGIPGLA